MKYYSVLLSALAILAIACSKDREAAPTAEIPATSTPVAEETSIPTTRRFPEIEEPNAPDGIERGQLPAAYTSDSAGLYVVAADGSSLVAVASDLEQPLMYSWDWAPEGSELAVSAGICRGESTQSIFDPEASTQRMLSRRRTVSAIAWTSTPELLIRDADSGYAAGSLQLEDAATGADRVEIAPEVWVQSVSPDGTRVAYIEAVDDAYGRLWAYDFASGERTLLAEKASYGDMAWSPDGTRLAYQTATSALAVVGADGRDSIVIGQGDYGASSITWLPDGAGFFFARPIDEESVVQFAAADGSVVEPLTQGSNLSISADGTLLAAYGPEQPLRVVDLRDGSATIVSADLVPAGWVAFSPDGSHLLFNAPPAQAPDGPGSPDLYVVKTDGSDLTRLVDSTAMGIYLATWSADGRYIAFWDAGIRECL